MLLAVLLAAHGDGSGQAEGGWLVVGWRCCWWSSCSCGACAAYAVVVLRWLRSTLYAVVARCVSLSLLVSEMITPPLAATLFIPRGASAARGHRQLHGEPAYVSLQIALQMVADRPFALSVHSVHVVLVVLI